MEVVLLRFLSGFALVGIVFTILYLISSYKSRFPDNGIKLILYIPSNSASKLEGLIRQIYCEGIPEKFMTDGKIYLIISPQDEEAMGILERLKKMYPIEVLPEQVSYCMITREKYVND